MNVFACHPLAFALINLYHVCASATFARVVRILSIRKAVLQTLLDKITRRLIELSSASSWEQLLSTNQSACHS